MKMHLRYCSQTVATTQLTWKVLGAYHRNTWRHRLTVTASPCLLCQLRAPNFTSIKTKAKPELLYSLEIWAEYLVLQPVFQWWRNSQELGEYGHQQTGQRTRCGPRSEQTPGKQQERLGTEEGFPPPLEAARKGQERTPRWEKPLEIGRQGCCE